MFINTYIHMYITTPFIPEILAEARPINMYPTWPIELYANNLFILVCVKPKIVPIINDKKQLIDKLVVQE